MESILLKYRPVPWIPITFKSKGSVPSSWEEINGRQLIALVSLQKNDISEFEFFHRFTGISLRVIKQLPEFLLWNISKTLEWCSNVKPHNSFVIEKLTIGDITLFCPLPKLKKMTFGQFIFSDTSFTTYSETQADGDLNKFVASLYLPAGIEFADDLITKYAFVVSRVPIRTREAIVVNYYMIREWLAEVYPMIFVKPVTPAQAKNDEKKKPAGDGWIRIFEQFVGDDIVNQDKYAGLPVHNVLRFLTTRIRKSYKK